jgi:hypothetical protein
MIAITLLLVAVLRLYRKAKAKSLSGSPLKLITTQAKELAKLTVLPLKLLSYETKVQIIRTGIRIVAQVVSSLLF